MVKTSLENITKYYETIWSNLRPANNLGCMHDTDTYKRVRLYNGYIIHYHDIGEISIYKVLRYASEPKNPITWVKEIILSSLVEAMQYIDSL